MTSDPTGSKSGNLSMPGLFGAATEYATDAAQRWVLFLDVMRQRGNAYREHAAQTAPNVLDYKGELVIDGRKLERPVNYLSGADRPAGRMSMIENQRGPSSSSTRAPGTAPASAASRPTARSASRCKAGHPCYFIGFLPDPDARADHRGHRPRRGGLPRAVIAPRHPRPRASPA